MSEINVFDERKRNQFTNHLSAKKVRYYQHKQQQGDWKDIHRDYTGKIRSLKKQEGNNDIMEIQSKFKTTFRIFFIHM